MLQYLYQQPRLVRFLASYLCIHFIFFGVLVQPLYAITSGPTQPEVQSFQPMGASDMVDIFSGNFSYNIPMFELPGPNGGYPFNLSYQGGVSMDEEASWVGLGWNLNVGAITRSVRGLPDEFNGSVSTNKDKITKYIHTKKDVSYGLTTSLSGTLNLGFTTKKEPKKDETAPPPTSTPPASTPPASTPPASTPPAKPPGSGKVGVGLTGSTSYHLSFSDVTGFSKTSTKGLDFGAAYTSKASKNNRNSKFGASYGASRSLSTDGGATTTDNFGLSFSSTSEEGFTKRNTSTSVSYSESVNSRSGLTRTLGASGSNASSNERVKYAKSYGGNVSFNLDRAGQSYPPSMEYPKVSTSVTVTPHFGISYNKNIPTPIPSLGMQVGVSGNYSIALNRSTNVVGKDDPVAAQYVMKPYGYLYSDLVKSDEKDNLMDVNREKDGAVKEGSLYLGMPNLTYDTYSLSGQGIGGSFRAFRSDVGFSCDNYVENTSSGYGLGAGVNLPIGGTTVDVSADFTYNRNNTITRKFTNGNGNTIDGNNALSFRAPKLLQKKSNTSPLELDETVYFKVFGENTTQSLQDFNNIGLYHPWQPTLFENEGSKVYDGINIGTESSPKLAQARNINPLKPKREHRNTYIQPILNSDIVAATGTTATSAATASVLREYQINYVQANSATPVSLVRCNANLPAHHIGGFTVTSSDGTRYIYALPVYNIRQIERTYSINNSVDKYTQLKTVPNQDINGNGTQEEYSSATETSRYPYAYMLTAVLGADYVDAGEAGPSVEDGGYWVKFTYQKTSDNYKWRTPYRDAFYNKGLYVSKDDDKASYSYGEKEIYYLYKAETQSHVALFQIAKRADGRGVEAENNVLYSTDITSTDANSFQYSLKTAKLFTRFEYGTGITPLALAKPIVSVNLKHDNSLCKKVDNNINTYNFLTGGSKEDTGKLTLTAISFTYENSERGTLSPYQFEYGYNPDYDTHKYDRWGFFKEPKDIADYYDFPYTNQEANYPRDKYAGAWCLSSINLPTGANIKVTYESDDYAFVQNKEAMQMHEIAGIGEVGKFSYNVKEQNPKIFFKLPDNIIDEEGLLKYLDEIRESEKTRQLYYRGMFRLKGEQNTYEMLSGWLDATSIAKVVVASPTPLVGTYASITVKTVDGYHPLAISAWQHMKTVQPYIIYRDNVEKKLEFQTEDWLGALFGVDFFINENLHREANLGYNGMCASNNWGNEMRKGKGWIRLNNVVGKKYGGGDRVKRILITDNWQVKNGEDAVYGQVYNYTMRDEKDDTGKRIISSGVATYEPTIGGEENALKYAHKETQKIVSADDNHFFFEGPINETLYPGPSVGYRQVKVQSLVAAYLAGNPAVADLEKYFQGIEKFSTSGEVVHEFYTAKDYPTISAATKAIIREDSKEESERLPYQKDYNMIAGQGFVIESNDMHGKPKAVTYYGQITTGTKEEKGKIQTQNPVSWVRYSYKNMPIRKFNGKDVLVPNSTVDVLLKDPKLNDPKEKIATIESRNMGLYYDIFADARMYSSESWNFTFGGQLAIGDGTVAPSLNIAPPYNGFSEDLRVVTFNKVIHRNGILEKTEAFDGGATVTTTNHIWGENGEVLVSSVDNNFNDRIYTYNIPAHFVYDLTGFAFYSQGLEPTISLSSIGGTRYRATLTHNGSSNMPDNSLFSVGDEFIIKGNSSWQSQRLIVLKKEDRVTAVRGRGNRTIETVLEFEGPASLSTPTPINLATLVYRSGKRNLLSAKVGHITVLVTKASRGIKPELEVIKEALFQRSRPEYCNMTFEVQTCN